MAAALTPHIASHGTNPRVHVKYFNNGDCPLSSCFDLDMHPGKLTTMANELVL